ncbi:host nuclease inhibitor protein [Ralstonia sp. ASV6]|uniref:host nuclease inhibitor protein n=1 Tax=Ralstonia sp. ASV6 TaxID=2795124 RepID=UPI0018ECCAC6|nr:host nuclease inhibitor protein [Ralstonia sp. ASV6]
MKIYAYCWKSSLIEFADVVPDGAIAFAQGPREAVVDLISVAARHSRKSEKLLVPGVPEAPETPDDSAKGDALARWINWLASRKGTGVRILGAGA